MSFLLFAVKKHQTEFLMFIALDISFLALIKNVATLYNTRFRSGTFNVQPAKKTAHAVKKIG